MKNILKNLNFGGLLALVAGMALMVSWKAVESGKAAPQWYQVTITDPSDPSNPANQQIGNQLPSGPSGDCSFDSGHMCAIQIDRKDYTGSITTVEQALELAEEEAVEVGFSRFRQP